MLKKVLLRFTQISHDRLVSIGFNVDNLFYRLADLNIYIESRGFYFVTEKGKKQFINNMLEVSKLIYGEVDYLHI